MCSRGTIFFPSFTRGFYISSTNVDWRVSEIYHRKTCAGYIYLPLLPCMDGFLCRLGCRWPFVSKLSFQDHTKVVGKLQGSFSTATGNVEWSIFAFAEKAYEAIGYHTVRLEMHNQRHPVLVSLLQSLKAAIAAANDIRCVYRSETTLRRDQHMNIFVVLTFSLLHFLPCTIANANCTGQ